MHTESFIAGKDRGERIAFRVPATKPITISQTTSMKSDDILINPEKGKQFYFENDCNGWACWLHEANESRFNSVAKGCRNIINVGF